MAAEIYRHATGNELRRGDWAAAAGFQLRWAVACDEAQARLLSSSGSEIKAFLGRISCCDWQLAVSSYAGPPLAMRRRQAAASRLKLYAPPCGAGSWQPAVKAHLCVHR